MSTLKEQIENMPKFDGFETIQTAAQEIITLSKSEERFKESNLEKINTEE